MQESIGFKFRQINKRLIESLITGEVYFSSPKQLNDPFDCQIDIKKSLKSAINKVSGIQRDILLSIQDKINNIFSDLEKDIKTFGVWSCSTELNNPLMWSHYGDDHKGICLTYKLSDRFVDYSPGDIIGLHPVEYVKNPITDWFIEKSKITGPLLPFNDFITSLIVKILISKDVCWKYEKEGRVIAKTQGLKKFGNSALQQVCFGLRTPESDKKLINQMWVCT